MLSIFSYNSQQEGKDVKLFLESDGFTLAHFVFFFFFLSEMKWPPAALGNSVSTVLLLSTFYILKIVFHFSNLETFFVPFVLAIST